MRFIAQPPFQKNLNPTRQQVALDIIPARDVLGQVGQHGNNPFSFRDHVQDTIVCHPLLHELLAFPGTVKSLRRNKITN